MEEVTIRRVSFQRMVFVVFGVVVMGFSFFSYIAHGQSTGVPGVDIDAENIPSLVRVEDVDATGKQIKIGRFRVGSAQTIDLTANFEVLGDLHTYGSLLVAASGVCSSSVCSFSSDGQKYPPFLVQIDQDFVGIGTNNNDETNGTLKDGYTPGTLGVFSGIDEFENGAVYVTATSDHAIYGQTAANLRAGVFGYVSSADSYGVFGKAVDVNNRGVVGINKSAEDAVAGYFKGNVVVTGGFLQGNASELLRVASVNDGFLPASDGGRGIGAWATRQDITAGPNTTTTYAINIGEGEILRSLDILIADTNSPEVYKTYGSHISEVGDANKIVVTHSTDDKTISIFNPSPTITYVVRFMAQIETGVSIRVSHDSTSISDLQPILFESSSNYELTAEVSATAQTFKWKFITSPVRGSLCEIANPNNCITTGEISGASVFYKQPTGPFSESNPPPAVTIRVTWGTESLSIFRDITLQLIDLQPVTSLGGYVTAEYGTNTQLTVSSLYDENTYNGSGLVYFLPLTSPRTGENLSTTGEYTPPTEGLFSSPGFEEKVNVTARFDNKFDFSFDVYIVPRINVETRFPDDGTSQENQVSHTVAVGQDLELEVGVVGVYEVAYEDTQVACTPASSCGLTENTSTYTLNATEIGEKVISVSWEAPTGESYPASFVYTRPPVSVYASKIESSGGGSGAPRTITFTVQGYTGGIGTLNTFLPVNNVAFTLPISSYNNHIGSGGAISTIYISAPSSTFAYFTSTSAGATYSVVGRNPNDLRDTTTQTITIPGGTEPCIDCDKYCPGASCPACCSIIIGSTS